MILWNEWVVETAVESAVNLKKNVFMHVMCMCLYVCVGLSCHLTPIVLSSFKWRRG